MKNHPSRLGSRAISLVADARGASLVEYLILVGLAAVLAIAAIAKFGRTASETAERQGEHVRTLEGADGEAPAAQAQINVNGAACAIRSWLSGGCPSGSCNCFASGTPVETPEGLVAIETITPGRLVLARDEETGAMAWAPVIRTFVTPDRPVLDVELTSATGDVEHFIATAAHPFWIEGKGWVRAGELETGDLVTSAHGPSLAVTSLSTRAERATVYNFEVERLHTYFVGKIGAWVHNGCEDPGWNGLGPGPNQLAREARERAVRRAREWVNLMADRWNRGGGADDLAWAVLRPFRGPGGQANLDALYRNGSIVYREGPFVIRITGGLDGLTDVISGLDELNRARPDRARAARLMSNLGVHRIPANPQLNAPQGPPLGLMLFGPQSDSTGLVWHVLDAAGGFVPGTPGPPSFAQPSPVTPPPPTPPAIIRR